MEENAVENGEASKIEYIQMNEHFKEGSKGNIQPYLDWWDRRSFCEKWLISALILITIFMLTFVPLSLSKSHVKADSQICYSDACIRKASQILTNMDRTASPCKNFYKFACGNHGRGGEVGPFIRISNQMYLQQKEILEEDVPRDIRPHSMARSYYRACLNLSRIETESLEDAKKIISKAGGWPVLDNATKDSSIPKWSDMMVKMRELGLPFQHLFLISLKRDDDRNSSMETITIDQPYFDVEVGYEMSEWSKLRYFSYRERLANYFGANDKVIKKDLDEVVEFENALKNMTMSWEDRFTDPNNLTNLHMPSEVWGEIIDILNRVMPQNSSTSKFIREKINVKAPSYFKGLPELLEKTPKRVLANYMIWRAVGTMTEFLPQKGRQIKKDYDISHFGQSARWMECIRDLKLGHLNIALASMYASKFQNDAKEAKTLFNHLKDAFKEELLASSWMDMQAKSAALSKLDAMKSSLDTLLDNMSPNKVEEFYKNIPYISDENTSLLEMDLILTKFYTDYILKISPIEVYDWNEEVIDALRSDALYHEKENKIVISPALMRSQFLDMKLPNYLNFASLGWAISHEMSRGFDDHAQLYNKDLWTSQTKSQFEKIQQCFIDQNDQFVQRIKGLKIEDSWNITDENNWSHNMGMKIARRGYNDWKNKFKDEEPKLVALGNYTDGQLFWISSANTYCQIKTETTHLHLEESFRILGPMINSEEFAKDFNCPVGSNMNPMKKCSV